MPLAIPLTLASVGYGIAGWALEIILIKRTIIREILMNFGTSRHIQTKRLERGTVFTIVFARNIIGRLPLNFTWTRRLSLNFGFSTWIRLHGYQWNSETFKRNRINPTIRNRIKSTLIKRSRIFLEIFSIIRRIFSLAIRLFANRLAGHVRLHGLTHVFHAVLCNKNGAGFSLIKGLIIAPFRAFIVTLELAVSVLQSYVFRLLSIIYTAETSRW